MRAERLFAIALAVPMLALTADWRTADPGYVFHFPRDHFSHPDFQTEWWYFTGNLRAADGHRFGYELTFFRQATSPVTQSPLEPATWRADQIYLAHLALSDIDGRSFFHTHRLNRTGPGLAGADQHGSRYWNGNWQVRWLRPRANNDMQLQAVVEDIQLDLSLRPQKPEIINGKSGVSRKGPLPGEASHYVSFTRIASSGSLRWKGRTFQVDGLSWMDHEFFTEPPGNTLIGWDWFAIQLDNGEEVMLYRLRREGAGEVSTGRDPAPSNRRGSSADLGAGHESVVLRSSLEDFSSGTYIDNRGNSQFLPASDFQLAPSSAWRSPHTGAQYPADWRVSVPKLQLELHEQTELPDQELNARNSPAPSYWEGAVSYSGTLRAKPIKGLGYLEMTGYGARMRLGSN